MRINIKRYKLKICKYHNVENTIEAIWKHLATNPMIYVEAVGSARPRLLQIIEGFWLKYSFTIDGLSKREEEIQLKNGTNVQRFTLSIGPIPS